MVHPIVFLLASILWVVLWLYDIAKGKKLEAKGRN